MRTYRLHEKKLRDACVPVMFYSHSSRGAPVIVPVPNVKPRFLCTREHLCFCPLIWAQFPSLQRAARGQGLCFLPSSMEDLLDASLPSPCCTTRSVLLCPTCVTLFKSAREAGRRGGFLGGRRPSGMIPGEVRECGPGGWVLMGNAGTGSQTQKPAP